MLPMRTRSKGSRTSLLFLDNQLPFIFTSVAEPEVHLMVTRKHLVSRERIWFCSQLWDPL